MTPTPKDVNEVRQRADKLGFRLETLGDGAQADRWWLTRSMNWVSQQPARTLAEISAVLDALESGQPDDAGGTTP